MKASLVLLCLALFVAVVFSCDPDGNGNPGPCTGIRSGTKFRNFWDPTHYWVCNGSAEAESLPCQAQTGFDANSLNCIPWSNWQWVAPCDDASTEV